MSEYICKIEIELQQIGTVFPTSDVVARTNERSPSTGNKKNTEDAPGVGSGTRATFLNELVRCGLDINIYMTASRNRAQNTCSLGSLTFPSWEPVQLDYNMLIWKSLLRAQHRHGQWNRGLCMHSIHSPATTCLQQMSSALDRWFYRKQIL